MLSHLLLQLAQLIIIPILILIVLTVLVAVLVLLKRRQLPRPRVQPQRRSIQTVDQQENVREQLEITTQKLAETQKQLEETLRQSAALGSQLAETRSQQEESQGRLVKTQEQLEDTRRQLAEIQEQLAASQNQLRKLSLGDETPVGKNLLDNQAWIKLAQECVTLFDELERKSANMDPQRREMAGYVCSQLEEILERCGVTIISGDSAFDERRHRPYPAVNRVAAGTTIAETLSPGFLVGPRVLRRARVRVAEETE